MAKVAAKPSPTTSPVVVLAGEELFSQRQELAKLQHEMFGDEDPGMGLVRMDAGSLGGEAMAVILDEVRTPSMFAPRKLVIVDPADPLFGRGDGEVDEDPGRLGNREILEKYLESPVEGNLLVLVCRKWLKTTRIHKMIAKMNGIRLCESKKEYEIPPWIIKQARDQYDKTIEPAAVERLAELIGSDLQRLDNELAKLSLYQPEAPTITTKAVDALVGFQAEQQIWDMINALAAKDAAVALKKIDELWGIDSKIEYTATGAVFFWLHQVLKARELVERRLPDAVIGKELKLWPPERAQLVLSLARSWGLEGAARWSDAILKVDIANKSSLGDPRRNLEKFVVELCTT